MNPEPTSFFDDESNRTPFELIKPSSAHAKELTKPYIINALFTCKNVTTNTSKQALFALHNHLIACYSHKSMAYEADLILDILHAKLKMIEPTEDGAGYKLQLTKNRGTIEFIHNDLGVVETWFNALKSSCVLSTFHEDFKAHKMIGKGSFAKVYLVEEKKTGKNFAVKAFAKESIASSGKNNSRVIMTNEIEILRSLDHEHIIKLHEVHETERSLYLVMELVEGKPLQDVLKQSSFRRDHSDAQITEMIRSILDALAYIATKNIMHRDLKPDNILIDKNGKLKIVDFGLATEINVPDYIFKKCGTPGYIAPEVFRYNQKISATNYNDRCDVFSAGCILFFMLFEAPFFDGTSASEVLLKNKEYSDFNAIYIIQKEINNPRSKINKDGLSLLILLLEYDHQKRISAAQSLNHAYFVDLQLSRTLQTKVEDDLHSLKDIQEKQINTFKLELSEKNIPSLPRTNGGASRNRFTAKDSFFLDVGKPDFNGCIDTLQGTSNTSANNSLFVRVEPQSSVSNVTSGFSPSPLTPEKKKQRASFRNNLPMNNQSFLKAAILNNAHMNTGSPKNSPLMIERRHSEQLSTMRFSQLTQQSPQSQSSDSDDGDDVGLEESDIVQTVEKIKISTPEMKPSKMQHVQKRMTAFPFMK